jgi:hypothetical protein
LFLLILLFSLRFSASRFFSVRFLGSPGASAATDAAWQAAARRFRARACDADSPSMTLDAAIS